MALKYELSDSPACLGHHFIVGLSGPVLADKDREILKNLRPMGVLLRAPNFRENVEYSLWLSSFKSLISEAQELSGREKFIVSIDHEGGKVHRAPAPITHFPDALFYSKKARETAKAMAIELASMGVNLSLAPVADIHSNPSNPIIGNRAFGKTPDEVIAGVIPFARELMANGVLACAKHFPGHGDTEQDSHLELPRLRLARAELEGRELKPFKALVDAGIPIILTAHIKFLNVDRRNPATLSKKILVEILRHGMNFQGVILSDDLDMQAIADNYSEQEIAERAVPATLDMFLFNHHPERGIKLAMAILKALREKKIREKMLEASFERIRHLIDDLLPCNKQRLLDASIFKEHAKLATSLRPH
jgi:beta-N-acetylhexosaminidase